eukprot:TRINITY_DN5626_c0_g1_i1.p1 TRINITY_DN5626_c0_g1~~TRINITY_DN5626_c0_g1_i1.p1  ORF type:complete len:693 (+),score=130.51 TRINITY_DN5626_c0_g1_i1:62-2080(+)
MSEEVSLVSELGKLKQLFDDKALTRAQFKAATDAVIARFSNAPVNPTPKQLQVRVQAPVAIPKTPPYFIYLYWDDSADLGQQTNLDNLKRSVQLAMQQKSGIDVTSAAMAGWFYSRKGRQIWQETEGSMHVDGDDKSMLHDLMALPKMTKTVLVVVTNSSAVLSADLHERNGLQHCLFITDMPVPIQSSMHCIALQAALMGHLEEPSPPVQKEVEQSITTEAEPPRTNIPISLLWDCATCPLQVPFSRFVELFRKHVSQVLSCRPDDLCVSGGYYSTAEVSPDLLVEINAFGLEKRVGGVGALITSMRAITSFSALGCACVLMTNNDSFKQQLDSLQKAKVSTVVVSDAFLDGGRDHSLQWADMNDRTDSAGHRLLVHWDMAECLLSKAHKPFSQILMEIKEHVKAKKVLGWDPTSACFKGTYHNASSNPRDSGDVEFHGLQRTKEPISTTLRRMAEIAKTEQPHAAVKTLLVVIADVGPLKNQLQSVMRGGYRVAVVTNSIVEVPSVVLSMKWDNLQRVSFETSAPRIIPNFHAREREVNNFSGELPFRIMKDEPASEEKKFEIHLPPARPAAVPVKKNKEEEVVAEPPVPPPPVEFILADDSDSSEDYLPLAVAEPSSFVEDEEELYCPQSANVNTASSTKRANAEASEQPEAKRQNVNGINYSVLLDAE